MIPERGGNRLLAFPWHIITRRLVQVRTLRGGPGTCIL